MKKHTKIKKIAFSGGVFQNTFLIDLIIENGKDDFELLTSFLSLNPDSWIDLDLSDIISLRTLAINILANVGLSIAALIGGKSLMSAVVNN